MLPQKASERWRRVGTMAAIDWSSLASISGIRLV